MNHKQTGWSYYVPEYGEDASGVRQIMVHEWQGIYDAESAAEFAAEDDWDNCDGWEAGVGEGPEIIVVDPHGKERRFSIEREARIHHMATELE